VAQTLMTCITYVVSVALPWLLGATGHADSADQVIEASRVRGGLVVHIGFGNGRLTPALRLNDRYVVHGLDTSPEAVDSSSTPPVDLRSPVAAEKRWLMQL